MQNKEDLEKIKQDLLSLRKEIIDSSRKAHAESLTLGNDGVADIGDMSANSYSQDVLMSLSQTQLGRIRDIDAALARIEQGAYGICVACEEEIAPRRLEVRPFSRYCIDCKEEFEKFGE
ncbi:MAG TPA: TraR/DksA C4-type zinc finger protein [Pelovirga sp.]|nr:TraR/DksA C4-type zinc finger protein [Pelovirga sp.]